MIPLQIFQRAASAIELYLEVLRFLDSAYKNPSTSDKGCRLTIKKNPTCYSICL